MDDMSKHPGPWTVEWLTSAPPRAVVIVDGNEKRVLHAHPDRRNTKDESQYRNDLKFTSRTLINHIEKGAI